MAWLPAAAGAAALLGNGKLALRGLPACLPSAGVQPAGRKGKEGRDEGTCPTAHRAAPCQHSCRERSPCLHVQVHRGSPQLDALLLNHILCNTGCSNCGLAKKSKQQRQAAAAAAVAPMGLSNGLAGLRCDRDRSDHAAVDGKRDKDAKTSQWTPFMWSAFTNPRLTLHWFGLGTKTA